MRNTSPIRINSLYMYLIYFHFPVHGDWGNWSSFSDCSQTCDGGRKTRYRECDNPRPDYGGRNCSGPEIDTEICNADVCPGTVVIYCCYKFPV